MLAKQEQYQENHLSSLIFLLTKLTMVEMQLSLLPSRHEAPGFHPQHCKNQRKKRREGREKSKEKERTAYSTLTTTWWYFFFSFTF